MLPFGSNINVKAAFNRVEAYNNSGNGIVVLGTGSTGTINATAADSMAANNETVGFAVQSGAGQAGASLTVVRSAAVNNGTGLIAIGGFAALRVGQSTVTGNTTSWSATSGGFLRSYGDNNIDGNFDADPAPTTIPTK